MANRSATCTSTPRPASFYRDNIEFPFFEFHLKGKVDPQSARGLRVRDRHQPVWRKDDTWPPKDVRQEVALLPGRTANSRFDAPMHPATLSTNTSAIPTSPCLTSPARPRHDARVHDRGSALRRVRAPTCWFTRPSRSTHDITVAGPLKPSSVRLHAGTDSDFVVKLIDVYPDDYPDPIPNPAGVRMGGYQQLVRGEADARQVPQQLFKTRAFHARQDGKGGVRHARHQPHLPPAVIASWCRCRAVGSRWWIATRRTFVDIYNAKATDFVKATEHVYRGANAPSGVKVDVRQ